MEFPQTTLSDNGDAFKQGPTLNLIRLNLTVNAELQMLFALAMLLTTGWSSIQLQELQTQSVPRIRPVGKGVDDL